MYTHFLTYPNIARIPMNTGSCNSAPIKCADISLILAPILTDLISGSPCDHNAFAPAMIEIVCNFGLPEIGCFSRECKKNCRFFPQTPSYKVKESG